MKRKDVIELAIKCGILADKPLPGHIGEQAYAERIESIVLFGIQIERDTIERESKCQLSTNN